MNMIIMVGCQYTRAHVIRVLVKAGVDINERTDFGKGTSVLALAYNYHDEDSTFINFLIIEMGSMSIEDEPEL